MLCVKRVLTSDCEDVVHSVDYYSEVFDKGFEVLSEVGVTLRHLNVRADMMGVEGFCFSSSILSYSFLRNVQREQSSDWDN